MICVEANFPPASAHVHSPYVWTYLKPFSSEHILTDIHLTLISMLNEGSILLQYIIPQWPFSGFPYILYIKSLTEKYQTTHKLWLNHWGRVTHICVRNQAIIGSDNGLSPGRRQAIIWTNAGILLIRPLETNFSEIAILIYTFPFKKMHMKMSSGKWRPFCLSLNVLNNWILKGHVTWQQMVDPGTLSWESSLPLVWTTGAHRFHQWVSIFEWVAVMWFKDKAPG